MLKQQGKKKNFLYKHFHNLMATVEVAAALWDLTMMFKRNFNKTCRFVWSHTLKNEDCCGYVTAVYRACLFKSSIQVRALYTWLAQLGYRPGVSGLSLKQLFSLSVHNKDLFCFRLKLCQVADQTRQEVRHRNGAEYLVSFQKGDSLCSLIFHF